MWGTPRLATLGYILQESFRSGPIQQSRARRASYQVLDAKRLFWPTLAADFDQHQALAIGTAAPRFLPANPRERYLEIERLAGQAAVPELLEIDQRPGHLRLPLPARFGAWL
ncbi:MAG: hypothetical protein EOO56_03345 [Hymenobacter sp.]|nr:MAG: hypothetical protein EOO56_03345 [Hymenobacter sp.]